MLYLNLIYKLWTDAIHFQSMRFCNMHRFEQKERVFIGLTCSHLRGRDVISNLRSCRWFNECCLLCSYSLVVEYIYSACRRDPFPIPTCRNIRDACWETICDVEDCPHLSIFEYASFTFNFEMKNHPGSCRYCF